MKHEHRLDTWREVRLRGTECVFACSCSKWEIKIFILDDIMRLSSKQDWGVYLVNMGMGAGRRFEVHARDGIIGQIISWLASLFRLIKNK